MLESVVQSLDPIAYELALFAGIGCLAIGLDDLAMDLSWFWHLMRRAKPAKFSGKAYGKRFAIFTPAWQEASVIGPMLKHAKSAWGAQDHVIFVGNYPNDAATRNEISGLECDTIVGVGHNVDGPTTKGDCLNAIWRGMLAHERRTGHHFEAVILHDAEDVVHADELRVFGEALDEFALVQIPVLPLANASSRWIGGHYADEFAEAHSRDLVVRHAIGASLPLAGVGCAIRRDALDALCHSRGGQPFAADSLTEDYELGLIAGALGFKSTIRRARDGGTGLPIAVHAHFPGKAEAAIRQKTRWSVGIALLGWQRLGWQGGIAEIWMRLRDRRTILSAFILACAYLASLQFALHLAVGWSAKLPPLHLEPSLHFMLLINLGFLLWRALIRAGCTGRHYGFEEALLSIPRMLISSFIAIASARRAVVYYRRHLTSGQLAWDKTEHHFPELDTP